MGAGYGAEGLGDAGYLDGGKVVVEAEEGEGAG